MNEDTKRKIFKIIKLINQSDKKERMHKLPISGIKRVLLPQIIQTF